MLHSFVAPLHLAESSSHIDFYDFKYGYGSNPANFSEARTGIWRYMISGYNFAEYPDRSGIAEAGGDDIFISNGLIRDEFNVPNVNNAIAGTMIHEIGHTLCLTNTASYSSQPVECVYRGVDSDSIQYITYGSSMNYRYQLHTVDYSKGIGGISDHDDWSAIRLGMSSFAEEQVELGQLSPDLERTERRVAFDMDRAQVNEMTPEKSKELYGPRQEDAGEPSSQTEGNKGEAGTDDAQIRTLDAERLIVEDMTPEKSRQMYASNQLLLVLLITGGVLVLISIVVLFKQKRAHKERS